jgi:hypothetical protein
MSRHKLVPALLLIAHTIVASTQAHGAPPATKADVEAAVKDVRKDYETVKKPGAFKRAKWSMGGGQNPSTIHILYAGGSEADYEKNVYAAPLRLRQVRIEKVLPALGEASAEFTFDKSGALVFAYTTGSDISGVTAFELYPTDTLRVYYRDGVAFRAVWTGVETNGRDVTVDAIAGTPDKEVARIQQAGTALAKYAAELQQALATLAR